MDTIETIDGALVQHGPHNDRIYRQVFRTYPFPVHRPDYLRNMLGEGVRHFAIRIRGRIAALAAAEIGTRARHAEMTDFATLPAFRGQGMVETSCAAWRKRCTRPASRRLSPSPGRPRRA